VLSGQATNIHFIVFELVIYNTPGEHANHYTTNAVVLIFVLISSWY